MKIAIFFPCSHLGEWSISAFEAGALPLSGTDAMILRVSLHLAQRDFNVLLFVDSLPTDHFAAPIEVTHVENAKRAVQEASNRECDIGLFVVGGGKILISLMEEAEKCRLPIILWDQNGPATELRTAIYRSPAVRRLITVSADQADALRDHPLFYKTYVIPNFVLPDFWRRPATVKTNAHVCFLGSLTPSKGFHHLARAWPMVRRERPDALLEVIGSARLYNREAALGPLKIAEASYEEAYIIPFLGHSRAEAAANGVTFAGLLPPLKIREIVCRARLVVVNPNCSGAEECCCVSSLEAAAAGAAIVGANRGGLRETVQHRKTGLLIGRQSELGRTIVRLLSFPTTTDRLGSCGQHFVQESFSAECVMPMWVEAIQESLQGRTPKSPDFSISRASAKDMAREFVRVAKFMVGKKFSPLCLASFKRLLKESYPPQKEKRCQ